MSRKKLIIGGLVSLVILLAGSVVLLLNGSNEMPRPVVNDPLPSATPESEEVAHREVSGEARAAKKTEIKRNPLLQRLPHDTPFWTLEYQGVADGRYQVAAVVYYSPGQNPEAKIAQQRPFIERFITGTGQPAGTYQVRYSSKRIDRNPQ